VPLVRKALDEGAVELCARLPSSLIVEVPVVDEPDD